MKSRTPTKAQKVRWDKIGQIGCVVCRKYKGQFSPCSIHHIDGRTKPGAHDLTIGLCGYHHQTAPYGEAVHNGRKDFEGKYGKQAELLEYQNRLIDEY